MSLQSDNSSMQDVDSLVIDLDNTGHREEYLGIVYKIFELYDLGHACIATKKAPSESLNPLWRAIPNDIGEACHNLSTIGKHPAVELAKEKYFPFDLFDFRQNYSGDRDTNALYTAFENNDIFHAYGLPVHSSDQELFVFVVGRASETISMPELLSLQAICSNAVNHMLTLEARPHETKKLDDTQSQLLILIANGKSMTEVAKDLELSEVSIEIMKRVIIEKLGAQNLPHAMITALIEGEITLTDCFV